MTLYLELPEVLRVATRVLAQRPQVRDFGLLSASVERPRTDVFGAETYPSLPEKAAALMHSLARNHVLVDGNKRSAWGCCLMMLAINGVRLVTPGAVSEGEFVLAVARGELEVPAIAQQLTDWADVRSR